MIIAAFAGVMVLVAVAVIVRITTDRAAFWALGALALVSTFNGYRIGAPIVDLVGLGALVVIAAHLVVSRARAPLPLWVLLGALGLCLSAFLTSVFPPPRHLLSSAIWLDYSTLIARGQAQIVQQPNGFVLAKALLAMVAVPLMAGVVCTDDGRCRRLGDLFVVSAMVNVMVALADFYGHVGIAQIPIQNGRASGLTNHPNTLALVCVMSLPFALSWLARSGRWRAAGLGAVPWLLTGVYVSGSRTGAGTAGVAILLTVLFSPTLRRLAPMAIPVTGMAVVALLAFTSFGAKATNQLRLNSGNVNAQFSDQQRNVLAQESSAQFHHSPFHGVGFTVIGSGHNIYRQVLAGTGLLGFVSFATIVLGYLMVGLRRRREFPDLVAAGSAAMIVWLLGGLKFNEIVERFIYIPAAVLFALAFAQRRVAPVAEPVLDPGEAAWRRHEESLALPALEPA